MLGPAVGQLHVTRLLLQTSVVAEQLVDTTGEGEQDQTEESSPLHDVEDHSPQRHLERAEVRVDTEYLNNLEVGGDHARTKQSFNTQTF